MKLIYRGAEAELWKTKYLDLPAIEKRRIKKKYRISEIDDKIRTERTKQEVNNMISAREVLSVPFIYDVDIEKMSITMEFISGEKIRDIFYKGKKIEGLSKKIGNFVKKMHNINLIHSDLTTSNMILFDDEIYFIDFGLAFKSNKVEDKAVDLLVFKKMVKSTHWKYSDDIWKSFELGYKDKKLFEKVKEIEKRARYA